MAGVNYNHGTTGSFWTCRQTSKWCTGKPDPPNLHQDEGQRAAFAGVETCLRPTIYHLGPPYLPWHGCISDRGTAASGGQTVLANDRNGRRLRLIASHHDDDDDALWIIFGFLQDECPNNVLALKANSFKRLLQLRIDFDSTTTKNEHVHFFVAALYPIKRQWPEHIMT